MTHDDFAQRLKLIAEAAPGLRAAGVMAVDVGDVRLRLAPPYGPPDAEQPTPPDAKPAEPTTEPEPDVLDDPATYVDGVVPGYELDEEPT